VIEEKDKDDDNRHGDEDANNERKAITTSLIFTYLSLL